MIRSSSVHYAGLHPSSRNQQVILDSDVAELYGLQTKRVNEAVSNNPKKFPEGYVLMLDNQEKAEEVEIFDHLQNLRFCHNYLKLSQKKGSIC